jgi:hypothetical protein
MLVSLRRSLVSAQNESDWRVLTGLHPVFARVVQVEVHLPSVCVLNLPSFRSAADQGKALRSDLSTAVVLMSTPDDLFFRRR